MITANYIDAILQLRPDAQVALVGGEGYDNIDWNGSVPIPQADLDAAIAAATAAKVARVESRVAQQELAAIDAQSISLIRTYIAAKADAPQALKDLEALALVKKSKIK